MSNKFDFEFFNELIAEEDITDINYNGRTLWVDHLKKGRYQVRLDISDDDIESFCYRFANYANKQFNNTFPIIESETSNLRVSILHKSIALSGYSISIRKSPDYLRLNTEMLVDSKYASLETLKFIQNLIKAKKNIIISGLPGVGKTEFLKYLCQYINNNERVITIEDNLEIRFPIIFEKKDGVMLKVNNTVNYRDAIKASLRQRVDWILLSEVRGEEVVELLQSISTGAHLISTIHADSASEIPQRILHMFPGNEISNEKLLYRIHESIDYGICIRSSVSESGISRYIFEIAKYYISNNMYHTEVIYTYKDFNNEREEDSI